MIVSSGYRKNGFDACGGSILRREHMSHWMGSKEMTDPDGVCFELGEEIEYVDPGFFEILPTICEIWIMNPKCKLALTEAEIELFHKNNVVLRGKFDTAAEHLAQQLKLPFLHLDVELAHFGNYFERGVDIITIRFYSDGTAYIHQDCRCQGISAGNTGGGEVSFNLPDDFLTSMSPEEIADKCWISDKVKQNGILRSLMNKARKKGGLLIDYSAR